MAAFFSNNLFQVIILAFLASLIGLGVLIIGIFRFSKSKSNIDQRLQTFVNNRDNNPTTNTRNRIFPREISGSFFSRTIKPFFQNIVNYFGKFTPTNSIAKLNSELLTAGNPYGMHAQQYYGISFLLLILGIGFGFLINFQNNFSDILIIFLGLLIVLMALLLPRMWLNSRVHARKDELRRNLPDALDMLSVCASAGLGFDQSLKKICEFWPSMLSFEFKHVIQEMDMGVSRSEALHNMSDRVDVDEISSFIAIITQAESIGMSFSDVLHSQAKQMRILRQFRAKEIANSMPAKMIVPLVIFIFPALIAVIIGPMIPTLLNLFS